MTVFHVEIVQKKASSASKVYIKNIVNSLISNLARGSLNYGATIKEAVLEENSELKEHVQSVKFCDISYNKTPLPTTNIEFVYHVFKLDEFGAETDTLTDASTGEVFAAAQMWALPARDFHGLWESLIYDSKLKEHMVRIVETAFEFVNLKPNIVTWNHLVLLHGPPGTGKTSLCRALAQKLAIRLDKRFPRARLIEINANNLFSKWFAESGKVVTRLFERITEIVEDQQLLVCVLIDEVESLAYARQVSLAGVEPSDSFRAVNALLTHLDRLSHYPNTLVLTTSNVTGAIDHAFIDRADINQYIAPPTASATYEILRSCCEELLAHEILHSNAVLSAIPLLDSSNDTEPTLQESLTLWKVAQEAAAAGISGRALRRLPILAMSLLSCRPPSLLEFLEGLRQALVEQLNDKVQMHKDPTAYLNGYK